MPAQIHPETAELIVILAMILGVFLIYAIIEVAKWFYQTMKKKYERKLLRVFNEGIIEGLNRRSGKVFEGVEKEDLIEYVDSYGRGYIEALQDCLEGQFPHESDMRREIDSVRREYGIVPETSE